jgi:hypothetical protein
MPAILVPPIDVAVKTEGTGQGVAPFLRFLNAKAARLKIVAEMPPLQSQVPVKCLIRSVLATENYCFGRRIG